MRKEIGDVNAVRITRGGLVIVGCRTVKQRDKALKIKQYDLTPVTSFPLKEKPCVKGVISGVSIDIDLDDFLKVEGVHPAFLADDLVSLPNG